MEQNIALEQHVDHLHEHVSVQEEQLAAQQAEIAKLKQLVRSLSGKDMAAEPSIE